MMRSLCKLTLAAALCTACDSGFSPPSFVDSLRVFAVKTEVRDANAAEYADTASGSPGAQVRLSLVGADGAVQTGVTPRPLQVAWFAGCHNPPTRQFFACYPLLNAVAAAIDPKLVSPNNASIPSSIFSAKAEATLSAENTFEFTLPENILSGAMQSDRDPVRFGVSFVFFAVCAGELQARPQIRDRVPVACVDPNSGRELGTKDFVTGFATVYTYEGVVNANPRLASVTLGGIELDTACNSDADCALPPGADARITRRCGDAKQCVLKLPNCRPGQCPKYLVVPELAADSTERLPGGDHEIVWANFYSNAGSFQVATELLNDRSIGRISAPGSYFEPAEAPLDRFDMWLTLDDQRGGAAFRHVEIELGE